MTEMHIAMANALRWTSDMPRPWYLPEVPPQSVGEYRAALGKLGKLGLVKVN